MMERTWEPEDDELERPSDDDVAKLNAAIDAVLEKRAALEAMVKVINRKVREMNRDLRKATVALERATDRVYTVADDVGIDVDSVRRDGQELEELLAALEPTELEPVELDI